MLWRRQCYCELFLEVFILVNTFWATRFPVVVDCAVCPTSRDLIQPCQCANNLIHCDKVQSEQQLRSAFAKLSQELVRQKVRPIFDEFKLVQSQLVELGGGGGPNKGDILSGVQFRKISILRNAKLRRIGPESFQSSTNITTELAFEDNAQLGEEDRDCHLLFQTIRKFSNSLQTLHLTDSAIKSIPEKAFGTKGVDGMGQLRELFMAENQIERIGNNAFTGLEMAELINLDGNQISELAPKSFEMSTTTTTPSNNAGPDSNGESGALLRIFLRSNRLTTESFLSATSSLFGRLRRRVYLNLNLNQLTSLPRAIFWPLFRGRSALTVARNPLKCDCDFRWLYQQQLLYNSSNPTADYLLRDYQCVLTREGGGGSNPSETETIVSEVDQADFAHCGTTDEVEDSDDDDQLRRSQCRNEFGGESEFDYDDQQECLNKASSRIMATSIRPIIAIAIWWLFLLVVLA